ncbi:DUF2267 domain-containing protein [Actinomadura gamaensis]|uniref:DUF2267 domain-containing protein n=1 Tax=Actinomadura gamaensis TaxID=1763541 RepID=A0ABV9TSJ8_9ACTN
MPSTGVRGLDRDVEVTRQWITVVAAAFGTTDREFAHRALRGWLRTVRDRLPAEVAAHFAAELPALLRGVFYDGWRPGRVPRKDDLDAFTEHFAADAGIGRADVPRTAALVTEALAARLPSGALTHVLDDLPRDLRRLLHPSAAPEHGTPI